MFYKEKSTVPCTKMHAKSSQHLVLSWDFYYKNYTWFEIQQNKFHEKRILDEGDMAPQSFN